MQKFWLMSAAIVLAACGPQTKTETELTPQQMAEIHDRVLTLDTHIDIPLTYMIEIDPSGPTDLQVDLPKLTKGQLDSGFWIVYTPQGDLTEQGYAAGLKIAQTRLAAIQSLNGVHQTHFELAKTAQDVRRIASGGKHAVMIGAVLKVRGFGSLKPVIAGMNYWSQRYQRPLASRLMAAPNARPRRC